MIVNEKLEAAYFIRFNEPIIFEGIAKEFTN